MGTRSSTFDGSASSGHHWQVQGLVAADRVGADRGAHQEADVEVPGGHAQRAGDRVHVQVDRRRFDAQAVDP